MRSAPNWQLNQRPSLGLTQSDVVLTMPVSKTDHDKLIDAQKLLSVAEGNFDAAMCACRSNPSGRNRAEVQRARSQLMKASRYIALLDQLLGR